MAKRTNNGWDVISDGASPRLRIWHIPGTNPEVRLKAYYGWAGFLLTYFAYWYHCKIERLDRGMPDDWGWNFRLVRGSVQSWSEHAAGMAIDLNSTRYPRGSRIRKRVARALIAARCRGFFGGVIKPGQDFGTTVDEMHYEIKGAPSTVTRVGKRCARFTYGKAVLKANPEFCKAKGIKVPK